MQELETQQIEMKRMVSFFKFSNAHASKLHVHVATISGRPTKAQFAVRGKDTYTEGIEGMRKNIIYVATAPGMHER